MSGKRIDENWLENRFRNANQSSEYVQTLSLWALHHKNQCDQITEVWYRVFQTVPEEQQIALLYLCNDILQTCKRRNAHAFKDTFKQVLASAISLVKEEKGKLSVARILQVWSERQVYEEEYVRALNALLHPEEKKAPERQPVILDLEDFDLKEVVKRISEVSDGWMGKEDGLKDKLDEYRNALADVALYAKSSTETKRHYIESNKQTINNTCKLYSQLERFINEKHVLLSHLELAQQHYHTVAKESKLIAMAYRNYKSRVENLRNKLQHRRNILMLAEQAKIDDDDDESEDDDVADDDVIRNSAFEDKLNDFYINNFTNNNKNVDNDVIESDVRSDDGLLNELYPTDVTAASTNQESPSSMQQNLYQQQENVPFKQQDATYQQQQPYQHQQQHNPYQQQQPQQHGYYPQQVAPEQQVILIEPQQDALQQQQQQIISPQPHLISPQHHLLSPQQQHLLLQQQNTEFQQDPSQQNLLQHQQLQQGQILIQPQQHTTTLKPPTTTTMPITSPQVIQPNTHVIEPTTTPPATQHSLSTTQHPLSTTQHPLSTTQNPIHALMPNTNTDTTQDPTPPPTTQSPFRLTTQSPSSSPPPPPPPKDGEEEEEEGVVVDDLGVKESESKGKVVEKKAKKKKKKHKKRRSSDGDDSGDSDDGWRRRRRKKRSGKVSGDEDEEEDDDDGEKENVRGRKKKEKKTKKSKSVSKNRHRSTEKHTHPAKQPSNTTNNYQEIVYIYGEDEDGWRRIEAMGEKTLAETVGCHVKILARNEVDQVLRWCCLQSTQQQQLAYQQQQLVGQQLHLPQQQILTQHPPPQLQQPLPQQPVQQPPTQQHSLPSSSSYPTSQHLPSPSQFCYGMGNQVLTQRQREEPSLADKNRSHYSTNRRTTTLKTIQLTDETPAVGSLANVPVAETITVTSTAVSNAASYDVLTDSKNRTPRSGDDDDLSDSSAELLQGTQTFTTPLGVSPNSHVMTHQAPPPMIANLSIKPPMLVTRPPAYLLQPPPNITRVVPNLQQPPPMFTLPPPHNPFMPQPAFVRPPQQFTHPF